MDKPAQKIKYGVEISDPDASAVRTTRSTTDEETNAVQTRNARHRRAGRRPQARSSGGDERGIGRYAGRPRRGARHHRRQEGGSPLSGYYRRGAGLSPRGTPAGPH